MVIIDFTVMNAFYIQGGTNCAIYATDLFVYFISLTGNIFERDKFQLHPCDLIGLWFVWKEKHKLRSRFQTKYISDYRNELARITSQRYI